MRIVPAGRVDSTSGGGLRSRPADVKTRSRYTLREITPRMADRFRDELREQAEVIRTAADRAAADHASAR